MPTNWGAIAPAGPRRDYMKGQPNKEKTIAYVFYQERLMRMRHLGGFYGMDIAMQKTMENIRNEKGEYVVIVSETREPIGFRVLEKNRNLVEVDLTWGRLYPALRHLAEENFFVDIRKEA